METVLIVIHLMVVLALIGIVLMQRSEGGALGIGGGSGGGLMSSRGAANALTRTTAILAAAFFATTIALSVVAKVSTSPSDVLDRAAEEKVVPSGADGDAEGGKTILEQIQKQPANEVPNN